MLYVIIEINGKQYKASKGGLLLVDRLSKNPGERVNFSRVLLAGDQKQTLIGRPHLENAEVTGQVMRQQKGKKVLVFKKKRRKDYKKSIGHRQRYTLVKIEEIKVKGLKEEEEKDGS